MKGLFVVAAIAAAVIGVTHPIIARAATSDDQARLILVNNKQPPPPPRVQPRQAPPQRQVQQVLPQQRQVFRPSGGQFQPEQRQGQAFRQEGQPQQHYAQQSLGHQPQGVRFASGRTEFQIHYAHNWGLRRLNFTSGYYPAGYIFTCTADNAITDGSMPYVSWNSTSQNVYDAEAAAQQACEQDPNDVDQNGNVMDCYVENCV